MSGSQQQQLRALGLLEGVGLASRRPLEAPPHRKVGGSVICGGGKMYISGRPGNQNGNPGSIYTPDVRVSLPAFGRAREALPK
jgi:hypothetical protein